MLCEIKQCRITKLAAEIGPLAEGHLSRSFCRADDDVMSHPCWLGTCGIGALLESTLEKSFEESDVSRVKSFGVESPL